MTENLVKKQAEMREFKKALKDISTIEERKQRARDKVTRRKELLEKELEKTLADIDESRPELERAVIEQWPEELAGDPVSFKGIRFKLANGELQMTEDKVVKLG
jgi:hypothetical protein